MVEPDYNPKPVAPDPTPIVAQKPVEPPKALNIPTALYRQHVRNNADINDIVPRIEAAKELDQ